MNWCNYDHSFSYIQDAHFTPIMLVTSDCHEQEDMEPLARSLLKYPAARESLNTADCVRLW